MGTVWWIVGLTLLVTFVLGAVSRRSRNRRRRAPGQAAERAAIRALWRLARRMPANRLLHDPATGQFVLILRHDVYLTVEVSDVNFTDFTDPDLLLGAVVTSYGIGGKGGPMPAPIRREQHPADLKLQQVQTWRQVKEVWEFNERTGAMNASLEELLLLHEQLERVLREQ
jgi:hypothetical protein